MIYSIDVETSSLDYPEIIELGYVAFENFNDFIINKSHSTFSQQYRPNVKIDYSTMSVHNITNSMVENCDKFDKSKFDFKETDYFIGHNINYDDYAFGHFPGTLIDTLPISRYLLQELDSHKLSAIIYSIDEDKAKKLLTNYHSALDDCKLCAYVLRYLIRCHGAINSLEDLLELNENSALPIRMTYGKYKGKFISDVMTEDSRYIQNYIMKIENDVSTATGYCNKKQHDNLLKAISLLRGY